MSEELVAEGHGDAVQFVVINSAASSASVSKLTDVCEHPVFQDTMQVDAWGLHGGTKDDIFIYESGALMTFLPQGGAVSISLGGPGYANVKNAILDAIAAP